MVESSGWMFGESADANDFSGVEVSECPPSEFDRSIQQLAFGSLALRSFEQWKYGRELRRNDCGLSAN
jgi:hypothetical protein